MYKTLCFLDRIPPGIQDTVIRPADVGQISKANPKTWALTMTVALPVWPMSHTQL
jgi:hypothetical protein